MQKQIMVFRCDVGRITRAACLIVSVACADQAQVAVSTHARGPIHYVHTRPDAQASRTFTRIGGVRELHDGRLLVIDVSERIVVVADLRNQSVHDVGREGAGPDEYRQPRALLAMPNGRSIMTDPGNGRLMEFNADGSIAGISPTQREQPTPDQALSIQAIWDTRGADMAGRLYFEVLPGPMLPGESKTVPIIRFNPETSEVDTVASYILRESALDIVTEGSGQNILVRPRAWPMRPEWAVSPDGRVAVVTPSPYRVSWFEELNALNGPANPYEPILVTPHDREQFLDLSAATPRGPSGPSEPRPPGAPPPRQKMAAEPVFPEFKPPFTGREAVIPAPDTTVWVRRTLAPSDSLEMYDIFDRQGHLTATAAFLSGSRVVGFGSGTIYVARRDADDLEYLHRIRR